MDRELRVIDEGGAESRLEGVRRPEWDGVGTRCPECGGDAVRHFSATGGRYGARDGAAVLRSEYWDARRTLLARCLGCGLLLYKHPAFDLLYDLDGDDDPGSNSGQSDARW